MYLLLLLLLLQTMNVQLSNAAAGHTACSDVAARFAAFSRAVCLRRDVKHNFTGRCTLHDCLHIAPMPSRKGHRLGIWPSISRYRYHQYHSVSADNGRFPDNLHRPK